MGMFANPVFGMGDDFGFDETKEAAIPPWQNIIDEMDAVEDPFEKMKIALYKLFPAMTTEKENELKVLAEELDESSTLVEEVDRLQDILNKLKDSPDPELGEHYLDGLKDFKGTIEESTILSDELKAKLIGQIDKMIEPLENMEDGQQVASYIYNAWSGHSSSGVVGGPVGIDPEPPRDSGPALDNITNLKEQLDGFHSLATGTGGHSASVQTKFQFEIGNWHARLGLQEQANETDLANNRSYISKMGR